MEFWSTQVIRDTSLDWKLRAMMIAFEPYLGEGGRLTKSLDDICALQGLPEATVFGRMGEALESRWMEQRDGEIYAVCPEEGDNG